MSFHKYKNIKEKRKLRVRKSLLKQVDRYRLSVFRSNKYCYAQIIDDWKRVTLVAASEKDISQADQKKNKAERASIVGESLAKKDEKQKIKKVVFDRGSYNYHGRVKALAEGARKGGLQF